MKRGQNKNQQARTVEHVTDWQSDYDRTITYKTIQDKYVAIYAVIFDGYHWI